ncbi:glucosamine--fructose-6-phosphate aminotransferase, isomerizing [Methanococcus vannielii SB]|jgi:glucosamine--fructose-6-phosphate aminotransferase (isomerizing)|uniref:Glutamine--fructose-6-phosphate aminotransferase [isomerizing] n=1 Tax=Methanococcus vannielii (strain ATCC 35089 / DSM 1224 / JCM 13029 / OCM 148 / SB) TaxID=406327 RepID=A6UQW1_METVS|nr:glutamine--fructose-6-phosphate transaminase (isomerizing) [Methanococcus vannielii]ABR54883.1 glucosamine--fructose-6-phosphate aminotransferase, isomerizing [Methanococcus vannielii SB]
MCGIIGYIGNKKASNVILNGLKRLEYRGYDSCGIASIFNDIEVRKNVGKVLEVSEKENFPEMNGNIGIGHSRWATHGKITKDNSHPHFDCTKEICIAHNGIISNYKELKETLIQNGHIFTSETDTEVIPHIIEEELKKFNELNEENYILGIQNAIKRLKGTYALLILHKKFPDMLVGIRNESPLILGISKEECFIGSDISAFLDYTKTAIPLNDMDIAVFNKKGGKNIDLKLLNNGKIVKRDVLKLDWDIESAEKGGFEHFMLKEIMEEPEILKNSIEISKGEIEELSKAVNNCDKIYITAMGTSLHAGMVFEYWFSKLGKLVIPIDSSEFLIKGIVDEKTLVIGITQSGETYDTIKALKYAKEKGAKTATIVNVLGSTATREADITIMMGSGIEIAVCATKTFMSQLVILYRLFIEYGKNIGIDMSSYEKELLNIPKYISKVLNERENIKELSKNLNAKNYLFVSKGINLPNALEGALKFKEITYLHAEGMSSSFLKHGTISLIDENMDTVALLPPTNSELFSSVTSNIEEIMARKGKVISISPIKNDELTIKVPDVLEEISPFIYAPVCQLLAYYKAVELKRDVDKPRGLAKSVTVE